MLAAVRDRLSTNELVAAYEAAGKNEQKLVRDLKRKGTNAEIERTLELYHFFPGIKLLRRAPEEDPG